jgi:hypothetical protein
MIKMNEEVMQFPRTLDEFIKEYSFTDNKEVYTNGSELIQVFRIKQWEEHKQNNWNELKQWLENHWQESQDIWFVKIIGKMQELEQGKDDNRLCMEKI